VYFEELAHADHNFPDGFSLLPGEASSNGVSCNILQTTYPTSMLESLGWSVLPFGVLLTSTHSASTTPTCSSDSNPIELTSLQVVRVLVRFVFN